MSVETLTWKKKIGRKR